MIGFVYFVIYIKCAVTQIQHSEADNIGTYKSEILFRIKLNQTQTVLNIDNTIFSKWLREKRRYSCLVSPKSM